MTVAPISLGGKPLLDDDHYVALITSCLARACEIALVALRPNDEGQIAYNIRHISLLRLVIGGLGALSFGTEKSIAYLEHHRDWLLRFTTSRSNTGREKIQQILYTFDQRAERMGDILLFLRTMAIEAWSTESYDSFDHSEGRWRLAIKDFQEYLIRFLENQIYQLDPLISDVILSSVFKVFHGSANQLGLNMLNEAFAYSLLLKAVAA